jgi:CHASE3 domain sensor protein
MSETNGARQLRHDIEHTRADLRVTVDELSTRLDVKAKARRRLHEANATVADAGARLKRSLPAPVRRFVDRIGAAAGPAVESTREQVRAHRKEIVLATGSAVLLLVVVSTRRSGQ